MATKGCRLAAVLGLAILLAGTALADVKLASVLGENMVLQQGMKVPVWGTADAADRGKIEPLSKGDLEQLLEIFTDTNRFVSVEPGNEVPLTHDIGTLRLMGDQGNSGVGIPLGRVQGIQVHERAFCSDTMEL